MQISTSLLGRRARTPTEAEISASRIGTRRAEWHERWIGKKGEIVAIYTGGTINKHGRDVMAAPHLVLHITESDTDEGARIGELLDLPLSMFTIIEGE